MKRTVYLFLFFSLVVPSDASRCFVCHHIPYPRDCAKLTTCSSEEYCHTEQIVTTSGTIVYNTGCLSKTRCASVSGLLVGKRSADSEDDISTCIECCTGDFCNNRGCGTQIIPTGQRGPYCYNCGSILDPKACTDIAVCDINEHCLLKSPAEFSGLPEIVYRSQCGSIAECATLSQGSSNFRCPTTCCNHDFCNDQCGLVSNNSMTTHMPHTTRYLLTPTTRPHAVVTIPVTGCKQGHNYDDITRICIKIHETRSIDRHHAMKACEAYGEQLVTIDSHEKTVFIENMILHHSRITDVSQRNYYIGAYDKHSTRVFYWPNNHTVIYTNWGGGDEVAHRHQPDGNAHNPQSCVFLYGSDHYSWHDDKCSHQHYFICEDRSTLKQSTVLGVTDGIHGPVTHAPHHSFHCDATDGYVHLKGGHAQLCVHIVTQHRVNWVNAQSACQKERGHLVVLNTGAKAQVMRRHLAHGTLSHQSGYWIGAKDFQQNNHFSWVTSQAFSHKDWDVGQPTDRGDHGHVQDCVVMWKESAVPYQWHSEYCPNSMAYICER